MELIHPHRNRKRSLYCRFPDTGYPPANPSQQKAALRGGRFPMEVTKDTIIGDILDYDGETAKFFLEIGMHCLGCPASRGESIEMACAVHGTDADELVEKINSYLKTK